MEIKKIFGPPGSGKTTFLLNIVEQELGDGVPSLNIGYFLSQERLPTKHGTAPSPSSLTSTRTLTSPGFARCTVWPTVV
jgi:GTPase SAR1 family protein